MMTPQPPQKKFYIDHIGRVHERDLHYWGITPANQEIISLMSLNEQIEILHIDTPVNVLRTK